MYKRAALKPDGRQQVFYSRRPIAEDVSAPSPEPRPLARSGHLRWHPLRGEWVAGRRVLHEGPRAVAFVPVCARYPYEVWVAPRRAAASFAELTPGEIVDLARSLKTVLLKFDGLWDKPFPYVMVWHQAPSDGLPHPEAHLHAELYPPYRMPGRLKYLAGTELGAGTFSADTLPEDKARELRAIEVKLE